VVSGRADLVPGRACVCGDSAAGRARGCGRRGYARMDDGRGGGEHWGCEGRADVGAGRGRGVGVLGFGRRGKGERSWVRWRWVWSFLGVRLGWDVWDGLRGGLRYQCWRYVVELNVIGFEELELFGIYIKRWVTAEGLK
jgi:hypothetical protein